MAITPDLSVDIGGLRIKNPVIAASGTFGYGTELSPFYDPSLLGAIVVKGLSLQPMPGNPPPRTVETPCGLLNSIGLANIGINAFIKEKLPLLADTAAPVIVNIYGNSVGEYSELAGRIEGVDGISAIEVNISCPNVEKGGMVFGTDPETASKVTDGVVKRTTKPVIVKLTPNVADIAVIAKAVESAGAGALSVTNTFLGMSVDIASRRPVLTNVVGGLSGPAIKPMALYLTYRAVEAVKIPVIGLGGIMNHQDAIEFLLVGARAIQVGTANFINPRAALEIVHGLRNFCERENLSDINHLIGSLIKE
ncbi:MAG: dihydroorotate dehydrogenase [Deltaproteobacteria bacterium]|nr:dihydroorotate dehydrogenase [Deltaproteobacteria bacterium]MBW2311831.1 dihydroorotate dehydrogenase [Deltaproteobacteria bacterium]RLB28944.1 MAG: dihydroorotate dehydrogenase [Deltaproteobacteria bacterium]